MDNMSTLVMSQFKYVNPQNDLIYNEKLEVSSENKPTNNTTPYHLNFNPWDAMFSLVQCVLSSVRLMGMDGFVNNLLYVIVL